MIIQKIKKINEHFSKKIGKSIQIVSGFCLDLLEYAHKSSIKRFKNEAMKNTFHIFIFILSSRMYYKKHFGNIFKDA